MSLLQEMARQAVLAKVGQRVKPLSRSYVERWLKGEFSLADQVMRKHGTEIRAWKEIVLSTMDTLTVDDLLEACKRVRPEFKDLWDSEEARSRLAMEWKSARTHVERL